MSSQKNFSVGVVGGGIGGVCLALGLLERNVNVHLYEKAPIFGEYGAGIGFEANSVKAMQICSPHIVDVFHQVSDRVSNSGGKADVFFDAIDGTCSPPRGGFSYKYDGVAAPVHRGEFLNGMVKHLPDEVCHLGKQITTVSEEEDGPVTLHFADGTTAEHDVVVGCDGIGSHIRQYIVGKDHPSARVRYSKGYSYRILLPMEDAIDSLGRERAMTPTLFFGHGARIVSIPLSHGKTYGIAAICNDSKPWPDAHRTVLPASKEDVLRDFSGFAPEVIDMLQKVTSDVDRWALFDLADNPVPTYARGRVCIAGDAAHASTPHLGVGAGFAIEDSAVLAELLSDEHVQGSKKDLVAALYAYQAVRTPRGNWLPSSARRNGNLMTYSVEGVGDDLEKLERESRGLSENAWEDRMDETIEEAKRILVQSLQ